MFKHTSHKLTFGLMAGILFGSIFFVAGYSVAEIRWDCSLTPEALAHLETINPQGQKRFLYGWLVGQTKEYIQLTPRKVEVGLSLEELEVILVSTAIVFFVGLSFLSLATFLRFSAALCIAMIAAGFSMQYGYCEKTTGQSNSLSFESINNRYQTNAFLYSWHIGNWKQNNPYQSDMSELVGLNAARAWLLLSLSLAIISTLLVTLISRWRRGQILPSAVT